MALSVKQHQHGANRQRASATGAARRPVAAVHPSRCVASRSLGKDAVDSFLDLAKLVAPSAGSKSPYDELASAIGRDVYVDVAGWHLYLRDMTAAPGLKMHTALAMQFGPQADRGLRESEVSAVLRKIPVKLGAGRTQLSLLDVLPSMCVADLTKLIEEHGRRR